MPQQKATVTKVALTKPTAVASNAEDHIIERIEKCLELANHPTASESEAKVAMFLADRMMNKYNVAMADLLGKEAQEQLAQNVNSSEVSIKSIKGDSHRVVHQRFVSTRARSMTVLFNCKHYSIRRVVEIVWTFYGIAEDTAAAAQAFEMIHNRIDWGFVHIVELLHPLATARVLRTAWALLPVGKKRKKPEKPENRRKKHWQQEIYPRRLSARWHWSVWRDGARI